MRRGFWMLVGLAACSQPQPQPPVTPASVTHARPPAQALTSPPVPHDAAVESSPLSDDPTLERFVARGEGIEVAVSWWTQTGTTHVAEELVITTPTGTLRMATAEDGEGPELPLIERIYPVTSNRWVLLGWSSYGSGMQTEHAWLVDGSRVPRVVDKLAWTTDRSHAGMAVEVSRKLEIGIPLPIDGALHDADGWQLVHGEKTYDLASVRKLPAHRVEVSSLGGYYTPPFQQQPIEREWSGAFVWWVADKRFTVQTL